MSAVLVVLRRGGPYLDSAAGLRRTLVVAALRRSGAEMRGGAAVWPARRGRATLRYRPPWLSVL